MPPSTSCSRSRNRKPARPIQYLDTTAAYDLWSEVYDSDGNFLQALDTLEMQRLLPQMLSHIPSPSPWKLVDLGCGTGRNTLYLLEEADATVIGLDVSPKMLEVAKSAVDARMAALSCGQGSAKAVELDVYDLLSDSPPPFVAQNADAVISTLVLEHIPISTFFIALSRILKPGGLALVTNMHYDMGIISQAGFVDPRTGQKVRPTSFAHTIDDVLAEAKRHGLNVVGEVLERAVDEMMVDSLGERARKWIGVTVWFGLRLQKHATTS